MLSDAGFQITQSFLRSAAGARLEWDWAKANRSCSFCRKRTQISFWRSSEKNWGLAGTASVIVLFALFVWRGFQIACARTDAVRKVIWAWALRC